ncbi:hypothetical protein RB195_015119 [Necator americanus]|uniref:glucuronosyltransferase n=1 Tax=Necator americanus TaxID=51031 RepID=A0ABR1E340_NECAM
MHRVFLRTAVFVINIVLVVNSSKILIFAPKFGISHINFLAKVADTLVDAGHNVTVYSPNIIAGVKTVRTKADVIDVDLGLSLDLSSAQRYVWQNDMASYIELGKIAMRPVRKLLKNLTYSDEFHTWIREQHFDMVISEGVMIFDAVFHKCGIEKYAITISTLPIEYMLDYIGVPNTPSFVPVNNKGFSVPMTYFERAQNLFELTLVKLLLHYSVIPEFEQLLADKFGDSGTTQKQADQLSYIFVNSDEILDFPRVITSKYKYIVFNAQNGKMVITCV